MKNWVKIAGISGIVIIALSVLIGLLGALIGPLYFVSFLISLLTSAAAVLFFYGFFVIGKKYKKTLLKVMSIYFMIIVIIGFLAYIPLISYMTGFQSSFSEMQQMEENLLQLEEQYGGIENVPEDVLAQEIGGYLGEILIFLIALYVISVLLYGIPSILLGVGILKLGKKVKYSKVTGILNIIGGATSVIFVGFIVLGVASIFEIVLLFAESDKFGK